MKARLLIFVVWSACAAWGLSGCDSGGTGAASAPEDAAFSVGDASGGTGGPEVGRSDARPMSDGAPTDQAATDRASADEGPPPADASPPCPDLGCPPGPCRLDTDCPGTRSCVEGLCIEPAVCFAAEDCDDPRVCAGGACSAPCLMDVDCGGELVCDLAVGACVPPIDCTEDSDCPGTRTCVDGHCPEPAACVAPDDCDTRRACRDGVCEAACGADAPCAGLLVCDAASSLCVEGERCEGVADCLEDRVCDAGTCTARCLDDSACEGTRSCDVITGLCPEPAECFVVADCDDLRLCALGRCRDACNEAAPCEGLQRCDLLNGVCVAPDVCLDDADCPDALCDAGQCHAACDSDADCGAPRTCELATGRCLSPARCANDLDCGGLLLCGLDSTCFRPDCVENEDCPAACPAACEAACIDQVCAAAAPRACGPGAACPASLVCAGLGVCALDFACEGDADCPVGAPLCDALDGRCLGCLGDQDCARAEICDAGVCNLSRNCADDDDCPGDRTCIAGQCAAAACEGDRFDRDQGSITLSARTYSGLVLCDGDEDLYDLSVPAGEGVRVLVRHDPAAGDLSVTLSDPLSVPPVFMRSDLHEGLEIVGLSDAPILRAPVLRIQGRAGRSVPYSVTVERLAPGLCVPDALEGVLGNHDAAHASPVGLGETELEVCAGDRDFLSLDLPAGTHLTLRAATLTAGEQVEVTLTDPDGGQLTRVNVADDGEELTTDIAQGGRHLVQVRGLQAATRTRVRLGVDLRPTTEVAACQDTLILAPGGPQLLPRRIPARRFMLGCGVGTDSDVLLEFRLPTASVVDLVTTGATVLSVRETCADPASEAACESPADGSSASLRGLRLDAGTYFVIVKVALGARPTISLTAAPVCARDQDCGANGLCVGGACQGRCARDADCAGAQTCQLATGRCLEPARCVEDGDCLGERQCRFDGQCFLPDCVENADCAVACVDEVCAPGAPAACDADGDCFGLQVCAPIGACVLNGRCVDDADCPGGSPVCDVGSGACVGCLVDDDCQPGEACQASQCEYLGICDGPASCPGDRICGNDDLCRPAPGCPGDRFEGQDAVTPLSARTYTGLLLCDGTSDHFLVQPNSGEGLRVTLRHDPSQGDLSLELTALPPRIERFGLSDGRLGVETVLLPPDMLIRPAQVVVSGRPGATVPYSLTIERTGADVCAPDALEGPTGNDSFEAAVALPPGPQTLSLCPADEDWLSLRVSAGTRFTASLTPDDLLISLHDDRGVRIADGLRGGGRVSVDGDFLAPGVAYLRARAPDAAPRRAVNLNIEASAAPGAEALACGHVLDLLPGVLLAPPDAVRVARFTVPCAFPFPGLSGDIVARFSLAAPARVTLQPADGSAVSIRQDCDDPNTQVLCALSGSPSLTDIQLAAGTYYAVVQAFSPTPPQLRMTIR